LARSFAVLVVLVLAVSCSPGRLAIPGELVVSAPDQNYILFWTAKGSRSLALSDLGVTGRLWGVQTASGGSIYGIPRSPDDPTGELGGSALVRAGAGSSPQTLFSRPGARILDFSVVDGGFVVLLQPVGAGCATVLWLDPSGAERRSLPAPCGMNELAAADSANVVVAGQQSPPLGRFMLFALGNGSFHELERGLHPVWFNRSQLMFEDKRCIRKLTPGAGASAEVACGRRFLRAASADGRYVVILEKMGEFFGDVSRVRVLDTATNRTSTVIDWSPGTKVSWRMPGAP
jgi:hypothetical protein